MDSTQIDVTLTISENPNGNGNTPCGRYNYQFDPDTAYVDKHNTKIVYNLASSNVGQYVMVNLYSTDTRDQLSAPDISDKAISVHHRNTVKQLTVVSIRVKDIRPVAAKTTGQERYLSCDPQVPNDPPPV